MLNQSEKAYHESKKALDAMAKLNALRRKEVDVSYESLLAPFYFKAGDLLLNYIQLNTDELGTVIPMQEESEDDDEEAEEEGEEEEESCEAENQEVGADQETPNEESKDAMMGEQKSTSEAGPQMTQIDTS